MVICYVFLRLYKIKMVSSKKQKKPKNRSNKIHLVFDEAKRREFLTGFHKRKLQRKKKAQEKLEQQLKEERKRLKTEAKESYKKLVVSSRPIPGLEHLLEDQYEDENVTVKIVELSANDIAAKNNWIGANTPKYVEEEEEVKETESPDETEEIPGMELKAKPKLKVKVEEHEFKSKKDIKKIIKKEATKKVQKSKVFQRKNKIERLKQKKKSLQQKKERFKLDKKRNRRHKGQNKSS